jgi:hypothetical protein
VIYFKIELKGGLNRSLDFTSPVYRCSFTLCEQVISYTEERVDKLRERENEESSRERVQIET